MNKTLCNDCLGVSYVYFQPLFFKILFGGNRAAGASNSKPAWKTKPTSCLKHTEWCIPHSFNPNHGFGDSWSQSDDLGEYCCSMRLTALFELHLRYMNIITIIHFIFPNKSTQTMISKTKEKTSTMISPKRVKVDNDRIDISQFRQW